MRAMAMLAGLVVAVAPGDVVERLHGALDPPMRVVLLLDLSGSMAEQRPGATESKHEYVRREVASFAARLPPRALLALRVFGDDVDACGPSRLVRPLAVLGEGGAGEVQRALAGLSPSGGTPLARAIHEAATDLGGEPGSIVVLSDGMDSCGGRDAVCAAAAAVSRGGARVRVDIVRAFVTPSDQQALACVPQLTGGRVLDLGDVRAPGGLSESLLAVLPLGVLHALVLIVLGWLAALGLCDLLCAGLGPRLGWGTAGLVADLALALLGAGWCVLWLSAVARVPVAAAVVLVVVAVVLVAVVLRRRAARGGPGAGPSAPAVAEEGLR